MKITIVGAGNVGATAAQITVDKALANYVVLLDIVEGIPQGKALDIQQSAAIQYSDTKIIGTNTYEQTANSDIVVITAGLPRKPGMSRDDLVTTNADIVKNATIQSVKYSPNAIIIVVSNPLDVMTYVSFVNSHLPRNKVIGMSGVLDTARFKSFICAALNVSIENVNAIVLGGHGDSMVPLDRYTTVAGIPLTDLLPKERIDAMLERTRNGGAEIVKHLKTGSAYYAPAASIVQMIDAIVHNRSRIMTCCVYLQGEFGYSDICLGVPVKIGSRGMEEIVNIKLSDNEKKAFDKSASDVREMINKLKK
ncbi:MAG: malate dehydrogenase [Ignavibacteria bacterium]|nr:malate dehydrogenase [Ignavibacteria bacterium]